MGGFFSRQESLSEFHQDQQNKFLAIQKLTQEIDDFVQVKSVDDQFCLMSLGCFIATENTKFYSGGVSLGSVDGSAFSTLATEDENKNKLAKTILANAFSSWLLERKSIFRIAEIGAGSGDLMSEILLIRQQVLENRNCDPDLKEFFKSLKFSIIDFAKMIKIQKKNISLNSQNIRFYPIDFSQDLIVANSFDFIYGNEIPDTQRVDFLEVKTLDNGEKKFFIQALRQNIGGLGNCVVEPSLIELSKELQEKISQNLYPIQDLSDGTYLLQFGFHALMHNIRQALKVDGNLMLIDYFSFQKDDVNNNLAFLASDGNVVSFHDYLNHIENPALQIILAKSLYNNSTLDITYSPAIGMDSCRKFNIKCSACDPEDYRALFIYSGEITVEDFASTYNQSYFAEEFRNIISLSVVPMDTEFAIARSLKKVLQDRVRGVGEFYSETPSTQTATISYSQAIENEIVEENLVR